MEVRCDGLVFETHPRDLRSALLIDPRSFDTWLGGGSVKREETARVGRHGSFYADGFLASKVTTITGKILADSEGTYERLKRKLQAFLVGRTRRMTVHHDDGLRTWGMVGLSMQATVTDYAGASHAAQFQVQVWSEDPFRYGELRNFGPAASVDAYHFGTSEATGSIEVPNGAASYTVTGPGGAYIVSGATAGGLHRIDMANGWFYRNDVLVEGVGRGDTWVIPAGQRVTHSISTGQLIVKVPDTYS